MAQQDLYKVLGVNKTASQDDVRKAYRRLARKHHPDVNQGNKDAGEKFKEVSAAYEVLSDEKRRKEYDEFGDVALRTGLYLAQAGDPAHAYARQGVGLNHLGFTAPDRGSLDRIREAMAARGFPAPELQHFGRDVAVFMKDRDGIRLEVIATYEQLRDADRREVAWARGERQTRSWFVAAGQAYQVGTIEPRELVDAMKSYFTNRFNHLEAVREFNTAAAALASPRPRETLVSARRVSSKLTALPGRQ